ncbi:hypothetical protein ABM029_19505 [Morganella morganii]|nr:hypothetical protein [Morganella morganii]
MSNNTNESDIEKEINNNIKDNLSSFMKSTAKNLTSFIPYGDKIVQLYSDFNKYSDNNEMQRLLRFFYGINHEDNPNMLIALGPEYAEMLMNFVMKDMENDKIDYYANFIINISDKGYSVSDKKNYLYILNKMTLSSIQLMRYYYISKMYDLSGYKNRESFEDAIVKKVAGFFSMNYSILMNYGLIEQPTTFYSGSVVNESLIQLSELIFDKSTLTPQYINEKEKDRYDVVIIKSTYSGCYYPGILVDQLSNKGVSVCVVDESQFEKHEVFSSVYVSTRESNKKEIGKEYIDLVVEGEGKLRSVPMDLKDENIHSINKDYVSRAGFSPICKIRLTESLNEISKKIITILGE